MNELLGVALAAIITWLNFVLIDTWMGLPEAPGVKGADVIGRDVKKRGGDLAGGFFQGNIVCSPDASAGTLLGAVGCYLIGIPEGGFIAALLVFIGNRLCADPGYAGTTGALTITVIIAACSCNWFNTSYVHCGNDYCYHYYSRCPSSSCIPITGCHC